MNGKSLIVENNVKNISIELRESLIDQDLSRDEIIKELLTIYKTNRYWIFRGHHKWNYSLRTTIERRKLDRGLRKGFYSSLITLFQSALHQYSDIESVPDREGILETQALMQHYGCPTTLLDWTNSPYIALYFATNDANMEDDTDAAIYAINILPIEQILRNYLVNCGLIKDESEYWRRNEPEVYRNIVSFGLSVDQGFILPVVPMIENVRQYLQQGHFTVNGNIFYGFEENLAIMLDYGLKNNIINDKSLNEILVKIKIPNNEKPRIQEDLLLMNITSATLFNDLDGYSKSFDQYLIRNRNTLDDYFGKLNK